MADLVNHHEEPPALLEADPPFSKEEMQIIRLLLLHKANCGIFCRIHGIVARVLESLDDIGELMSAQHRVSESSYTELEKTAKFLGITDERLTELQEYIITIDTTV